MTPMTPLFAPATESDPPRTGVIAELGVNHDGDLGTALTLVDAAAEAGADAVKVQLFHPDRLLSNQALLAAYQKDRAGDARALLADLAMEIDDLGLIGERARQHGMRFLATPFSLDDIADLTTLKVDAVKIASPDAVNLPLLEAAATLGKPLLISTGTCELDELAPAAMILREHASGGHDDHSVTGPEHDFREASVSGGVLLHCVSCYPTPREHAALSAIGVLHKTLGVPIGYSDHTTGIDTGALAVAAGAVVLEKHLTHDTAAPGPDHAASLPPNMFAAYVQRVRDAEALLGPAAKRVLTVERDVRRVSRQSVCARRDLPIGHRLRAEDLTLKRPGTGIPAAQWARVIGRQLLSDVRANDLLMPDQVKLD